MIERIKDINEAKLKHRSLESAHIAYQDILNLPECIELNKFGIFMEPKENAAFRSSGNVILSMEKNSVIILDKDLYSLVNNERNADNPLLWINLKKDGYIVFDGLLIYWNIIKVRASNLSSIKAYANNLKIVRTEIIKASNSQKKWKLANDSSSKEARDETRIDNDTISNISDLW